MGYDFTSMTDDELSSLISEACKEKDCRNRAQEEKAWQKVCEAIREYTERYGSIDVGSGDFYISEECDFTRTGEISGWD